MHNTQNQTHMAFFWGKYLFSGNEVHTQGVNLELVTTFVSTFFVPYIHTHLCILSYTLIYLKCFRIKHLKLTHIKTYQKKTNGHLPLLNSAQCSSYVSSPIPRVPKGETVHLLLSKKNTYSILYFPPPHSLSLY